MFKHQASVRAENSPAVVINKDVVRVAVTTILEQKGTSDGMHLRFGIHFTSNCKIETGMKLKTFTKKMLEFCAFFHVCELELWLVPNV